MSILETFYILFKSNGADAAGDIEKVDDASDKAEKGLKKVDKAADGLAKSFISMAKQIAAPLLALASVGSLISLATGRAANIRQLDAFSAKLNSSVSDVDAFQRSIQSLGGEGTAAIDSLTKLGEKVNEAFADKDSGARKDFKEWGLAFKDARGQALGATDAMLELSKNLEGLSNAEALARIKKLGIEDATTIEALMLGRETLRAHIAAQKEMGVVTEEQASAVRDYYSELGNAKNALTSFGNVLMAFVLPSVTRAIEYFNMLAGWMTRNKTLVTGFFIGVAAAVTTYFLPAMTAAAAAVIAATWPFIAMGAAITAVGAAFALAYEDVVAFLDGQPSLIGELVKKYEWFGDIVRGIGKVFETLKLATIVTFQAIGAAWDILVSAWKAAPGVLGPIFSAVQNAVESFAEKYFSALDTLRPLWEALGNAAKLAGEIASLAFGRLSEDAAALSQRFSQRFEEIKTALKDAFTSMVGDIDPLIEKVKVAADLFKETFLIAFNAIKAAWSATIGAIADGINSVIEKVRGLLDIGGQRAAANDNAAAAGAAIGATVGKGRTELDTMSTNSINGQTSQTLAGAAAVQNTSNVSVGSVTVNTQATDAKGVAAAVKGELQRQLRTTAAQLDDGVQN